MTNRERVLRTRARAMMVKMAEENEKLRRQEWRENAPCREIARRLLASWLGEEYP